MDTKKSSAPAHHPEIAAGDPFVAAAQRQESPHGCYDGWVYLGFEGEDADGNHVEDIERVPCRRCNPR